MRKIYIFTLAIFVSVIGFANTGLGDFSGNDAGKAGAQFLKIGVGARAIGMGEAYGAVSNDANAVYWNPAGLNQLESKEVSFMHAVWLEAINYENSTKTLFFRYLFQTMKLDQHTPFKFLPYMQDYSQPWTDERFYKYFNITKEEQNIIKENMI